MTFNKTLYQKTFIRKQLKKHLEVETKKHLSNQPLINYQQQQFIHYMEYSNSVIIPIFSVCWAKVMIMLHM